MIGQTVKLNGVDLLVLDELSNQYFVWAYNTGVKSIFNSEEDGNCYQGSVIENAVLNLMGNSGLYWFAIGVKPLTFDDYNRYKEIIKPYITKPFWLKDDCSRSPRYGCVIFSDGSVGYSLCDSIHCLAPAFYISKEYIDSNINNNTQERKEETTMEKKENIVAKVKRRPYLLTDLECNEIYVRLNMPDVCEDFFGWLKDEGIIPDRYALECLDMASWKEIDF